jgi:hypothetical protein
MIGGLCQHDDALIQQDRDFPQLWRLKTARNRAAFFEQQIIRKFALVRQSADEVREK